MYNARNCLKLQDIDAIEYSYEFVKRVINKSCDKGDRERELVSHLLSALYPDVFSSNAIGKGFERLFEIVDEIEKDCPAARNILATFLARAVIDEILPPSFLADAVVCTLGKEIVEHAKHMLSQHHAGAKLEHSWGPGDGRPVEELKVAIDQLLQEYLLSKDEVEAVRCITELNSPLYFHEIVKRAVYNAMDKPTADQEHMSALLKKLAQAELLSPQQAEKGFNRLYRLLPDLALDTPSAVQVLENFTLRAKRDGVLKQSYTPPPASE
jgi:programmed cell death protein 4